jgi:hypothetical protein
MRRLAPAIAAIIVATSAHAGSPEWVDQARDSAARLGKQLKAELVSALESAGPTGGVEVCRDRAPEIAASVSGDGFSVGRTALRLRNPDNAPDAWERDVLQQFADRLEQGAEPASLEHWEVRETDGQRVGRWMKAIPMQPQCRTCHGTDVAEPLAETIESLYPEDRATGFEVGELRGAFTVRVALPASEPTDEAASAR